MIKNIIIPVETNARELKSRLFVASFFLKEGHNVFIGPSSILHKHIYKFPAGLILENDVTTQNYAFLSKAKNLGFKVAAWDEESISVVSDAWYVSQRVNIDSMNKLDIFFTRSLQDKIEIEKRFSKISTKIIPAGNPRIDILTNSFRSEVYDKNGPLVVMSRFSRSNPMSSREIVLNNVIRKFNLKDANKTFYKEYINHCHQIYEKFIFMVSRLIKNFQSQKIIIRPHPSENFKTWKKLSKSHSNVLVDFSGTAEEISERASAVIHNGCTTGLEAALLGIPVYSYMPIKSDKYDIPLPNKVSKCYEEMESMFKDIRELKNRKISRKDLSNKTWTILKDGWIGDKTNKLSSKIIYDHCSKLELKNNLLFIIRPLLKVFYLLNNFRISIRLFFSRKKRVVSKKESLRYHLQKNPPIEKYQIHNYLQSFSRDNFIIKEKFNGWWEIKNKK